MIVDWFYIVYGVKSWAKNEDGSAVMETAMLLPPLLVLLMGVYDLGNGIILAERTITASQIAADLVSRGRTMDQATLNEIIEGSKLAFQPYALSDYGVDVVSIRFDESQNPEVLWRQTENMAPNDVAVASVAGLGAEGDGMIIVTVKYTYIPQFAHLFVDPFNFTEVSFSRGRRSPTVTWDG